MKNYEEAKEIAKKIANGYPMPPTTITEGDMRAMLENAAMQMYEECIRYE